MEDSPSTHSEECSGGADSSPTSAACTADHGADCAACNLAENMTKASDLLHWVNAYLGTRYDKVEDLSSGAAYCQFTDILFPGAVNLSKVNLKAKRLRESIQNYEALREAFDQVGVNRELPVERLVDGSYRDNLELIQWFKDLFEAQLPVPAAVPAEVCHAVPYMYATSTLFGSHAPLPDYRFTEDNYEETGANAEETGNGTSGGGLPPCRYAGYPPRGATGPAGGAGAGDFSDTVDELASQVVELKESLYWLELERNFYYSKLCEIEVLCWEHERDHGKECVSEKILDLMRGSDDEDWYGTDEDAAQSGEQVAEATEQEPQ
uniref:Microtubule-associated protein, RP/EB family n=1 Tax=Rhipicephalus appendiculatus TaxID=34631 RepID=A0A131YQB7_RHIAP